MTASDLPFVAVTSLNALLTKRGTLRGDVKPALGISYLVHLVSALAFFMVARLPGGPGDAGLGPQAKLVSASLLYPGAEGGAAPKPDEPKPEPEPQEAPPEVEPLPPEPEPPRPAEYREVKRNATPTPKPKPSRTPFERPTPRLTPPPARATTPGRAGSGGSANDELLKVAGGERGSPTGVLGGDPDSDGGGGGGGLGMLIFTDQWYVERIRDIVYRNWGNPFAGRARPDHVRLATVVSFRIDRDGRISEAKLVQSSGNDAWDRSAIRAAENSRLPPLPASYPGRDLRVRYRFYDEGAP